MALPDFVLDQDRLIGEKVRLSGLYQQIQDVTILAATEDDPNPVDLDISKLPRQVRSELLNCPDRECTFQVEGTVQRHHGSIEILADYAQKVPGD